MTGVQTCALPICGHFSGSAQLEWCDRRLLARIHRATLDRLRREIEPVSAADFLRFLTGWQHVGGHATAGSGIGAGGGVGSGVGSDDRRVEGPLGVSAVVGQLQGYEIPASAWEASVLPLRVARYDPAWLDQLCLSGEVAWLRLSQPAPQGEVERQQAGANRVSPITLLYREQMQQWMAATAPLGFAATSALGTRAAMVIEYLERNGASFFQDIVSGTRQLRTEVESGLRELIAAGLVIGDGFAGLRALAIAPDKTLGTKIGRAHV